MRTYAVKELFGPTLQGEGEHAGLPCLFVRLAGCNAWDGKPETRASSACPYCDTDFRGGEHLTSTDIITQLIQKLPTNHSAPIGCVLTGGEPLLQADETLLQELGAHFSWVDIETNGTRPCPPHPKNVFISCSPKKIANQPIVVKPDWWKVLIPDQEEFLYQARTSGLPVYVQPTCPDNGPHGDEYKARIEHCLQLCFQFGYRLSLQQHKYLGIP